MEIIVDPIWSWPLVVLVSVGLLAMVLVSYPPRIRHLPVFPRRLLLGVRCAAVLLLVLAMLRPAAQFNETDTHSAAFFVVTDVSRSMNTGDGPGGSTRRQALVKTVADSEPQLSRLREDLEIELFDFAGQVKQVEELSQEATGDETAIGSVMKELLRETQNKRVVGVVLMSDGAQRSFRGSNVDPRTMARRFADSQIPIHTVGYGGTGLSGTSFDAAVEDLLVDPLVFEKKAVPVTAMIRVLGGAGQELSVRLLVEDRRGKNPGEAGEMRVPPAVSNARPSVRIRVPGDSEVIPVELLYVPQQSGESKIALEVVPLDDELRTSNNHRETIISVQKGGINVAYYDKARWEQKFIKGVNTSEKIQLDFQAIHKKKLQDLTRLDPEWFLPDKYDAYIIGDVSADVFGPRLLRELADRVKEGAGLLMTGGYESFGPGGYARTPLADLLPVEMTVSETVRGGKIDERLHLQRSLQMLPTERGLSRFVMRLDTPEKNLDAWKSLPKLERANRLRPRKGLVEVWAATPDGTPLLLAHEVGRARVMAFAADTTWLWVMEGRRKLHQRFWRQVILWLTRKEYVGDDTVWARVEPRNFSPHQRAGITFGARTERGEPVADANFRVTVTDPDGGKHEVSVGRQGTENFAEFSNTRIPGDYWIRVEAGKEGNSLGFDAHSRFVVDARDLELDNPAADFGLLEEISALTGGSTMPPEQFSSFLSRLLEAGGTNPEVTKFRQVRFWDSWSFLSLFVALMSVEWFVRKRRGLV
jgi:hypothetical protein